MGSTKSCRSCWDLPLVTTYRCWKVMRTKMVAKRLRIARTRQDQRQETPLATLAFWTYSPSLARSTSTQAKRIHSQIFLVSRLVLPAIPPYLCPKNASAPTGANGPCQTPSSTMLDWTQPSCWCCFLSFRRKKFANWIKVDQAAIKNNNLYAMLYGWNGNQ